MSLWSWAVEAYARPGVEAVLLEMQDLHGQSIPLLLWAAWAADEGRALDGAVLKSAAEMAQMWERGATGPLRQARRALKPQRVGIPDAAREALRDQVKAAELQAEKVLLESLEAMADRAGPPSELAPALLAAATAASRSAPAAVIQRLADALAAGAKVQALRPQAVIARPERVREDEGAAINGLDADEEAAIRAQLSALRTEHQDLDDAVRALAASPLPDMIQMARLKKKKLTLRDEITALEDRLTPDIIA